MLHWKLVVHCRLRQELHRRPDCRRAWRTGTVRCLGALRDRCFLEGRYASAIRYGLWSLFLSPRNRPRWEWYRPIDALGRLLLPFGRRRPDPLSS
jgi:hypothetical protein